MPTPRTRHAFDMDNPRHALLLLVGLSLLLMLYNLDGTPFRGMYDDVDRSLIARNMAESGDWLVARYVQGPLYTKPPLMYWMAASLGVLTGRSDELPGNLTSVLSMLAVVLATFWAGRNLFGNRVGLWAGMLLVTMHLFLAMSRQALLDTPMLGGFALAFGSLVHLAFSGTRRPTLWWLLAALGLALAFMTKGPVVLPIFLMLWLPLWPSVPAVRPGPCRLALAIGLILAVTLPWPLLLLSKAPEAAQVWHSELFGRLGDGKQYLEWTQKPFWFYGPDLINTLPWVLLLPWSVFRAWPHRRNPRYTILLWWALGGFVFFSLASATKRSYYLLPLYPAFALLMAAGWKDLCRLADGGSEGGWREKWGPRLSGGLLLVLGLGLLVLPWVYPDIPRTSFTICGLITTIFSVLAMTAARQERWVRNLAFLVAGATFLHLAFFGHLVPPTNNYHSGKTFFTEAAPLLKDQKVMLVEVPLALSSFYLHGVPYSNVQRDDLHRALAAKPDHLVIMRPEHARRVAGLEPLLERFFREPFGKERGLGLYRQRPPQP